MAFTEKVRVMCSFVLYEGSRQPRSLAHFGRYWLGDATVAQREYFSAVRE